jgi:hypothetical protein
MLGSSVLMLTLVIVLTRYSSIRTLTPERVSHPGIGVGMRTASPSRTLGGLVGVGFDGDQLSHPDGELCIQIPTWVDACLQR